MKRKVQIIATMLAHNHYHFNAILKSYRIENMTLKNNFAIKRHLATRKTQNLQFTISPKYVSFESITITIFMPLKDVGNNNFLTCSSKQSRNCTKPQSIYNI